MSPLLRYSPFLLALVVACSTGEAPIPVHLDSAPVVTFEEVDPSTPGALYVGFDRRLEPKENVRIYLPLLRYLERKTSLRFKLRLPAPGATVVDELGNGNVQFAIVGPLTYLQAHEEHGVEPLVRGLNQQRRGEYRASIIVAPPSQVHHVSDLRRRRFAFGSPTSTQGHLIPRIMLHQARVPLAELASFEFAGSHVESADAVLSGRCDAAAVQDTLARSLETRGLVRIIAMSDAYPSSGIVVGSGVDASVRSTVRAALLEFDPEGRDAAGLYHWDRSEMPGGFAAAEDRDYENLRSWAFRLGVLERKRSAMSRGKP